MPRNKKDWIQSTVKLAAKKKAKQTLAKKLVEGRPALVVKPGMSGKALQKKVSKISSTK